MHWGPLWCLRALVYFGFKLCHVKGFSFYFSVFVSKESTHFEAAFVFMLNIIRESCTLYVYK